MKPLTLEYIAGFVDGEGSFMIKKKYGGDYSPAFSIANTDKQVIYDIRQYFSLSVNIGIAKAPTPKHKIAYRLKTLNIDDCKSIARLLEPHLRIKQEQAKIIMQFYRSNQTRIAGKFSTDFSTRAHNHKLYTKITRLNKKGPPTQGANEDLQQEPDPQLNLLDLNQKEPLKQLKGAN